jgi:cell division septation protein DedD
MAGFSYTGIGTTDPMNSGLDLSFGTSSPAPMAPLSSGAPSTQTATAAAVATNPVSPSGVASPAGAADAGGAAPMINPVTGEVLNPTFFQKGGGFSVALGALQTLGNLWNSFQQIKVAKDTLAFQKDAYQTNLANTTKDYNTRLESDARVSGQMSGWTQQQTDTYVKEHSL